MEGEKRITRASTVGIFAANVSKDCGTRSRLPAGARRDAQSLSGNGVVSYGTSQTLILDKRGLGFHRDLRIRFLSQTGDVCGCSIFLECIETTESQALSWGLCGLSRGNGLVAS